jgi:putative ABC transport system permease protein
MAEDLDDAAVPARSHDSRRCSVVDSPAGVGVIAHVVSQRMAEMAVRQALGATRAQILATVLREGGSLVAGGLLVGVSVTWWTGRLVSGYIFDVSARDPFVLGFSAAIVAVLALLATLIPARRATSLQSARALRGD